MSKIVSLSQYALEKAVLYYIQHTKDSDIAHLTLVEDFMVPYGFRFKYDRQKIRPELCVYRVHETNVCNKLSSIHCVFEYPCECKNCKYYSETNDFISYIDRNIIEYKATLAKYNKEELDVD